MKKLGNWIMMGGFMLIGGASGVLITQAMERLTWSESALPAQLGLFALLLLAVYAAMVLQIAIHEGGHCLFGLLTGYKFVSYRLFSLMWINDGTATRFRRFSLAGTGGQCLMEPPEMVDGRLPVTLYNLGGSLLNVVSAALCFGLAQAFHDNSLLWALLMVMAVTGLGFAVMNGVPMRLNTMDNDGMNAWALRRDAEARRAFWVQMKMSALSARGVRLKDMPEAWFACPDAAGMQNALVASLAVFRANRLMDMQDFDAADALMARLLAKPGATPGIYLILLNSDRLYIELTGENRSARVEALLTPAQKKGMKALKGQLSILRTQHALALLHEHNAEKAEALEKRMRKMAERYPYPQDAEAELALVERAKRRAKG